MIDKLIQKFIEKLKAGQIPLYNEAGLQHELGYFLRCNNINTYFEYNINLIFKNIQQELLKKELDLFIDQKDKKYCIEIKFPNKGAFPRRMTQSIVDLFFLQQLINLGFAKGFFLFITQLKT